MPPLVIVKQRVHAIPLAPLKVPDFGLVFGHSLVSGYWLFSWLSIVSLLFCAVCGGIDGPLAAVTVPSLLGSRSVIDSASLLSTVQPVGTATVSASLDSVLGPVEVEVGEATGLGVVAGVGLGTSAMPPPARLAEPRLPRIARAVPPPAISTMRATTTAIINVHGVRWAGTADPGAGV